MRPDILNPLFAEVEVLKGVGPQVAKQLKKLGLERVLDVLYHLPTGAIERVRAPHASSALLGRNVILELTPFDTRHRQALVGVDCADVHPYFCHSWVRPYFSTATRISSSVASRP